MGERKLISEISIAPLAAHKEFIPQCALWAYNEWGQYVEGRTVAYYEAMFEEYATKTGIPHVKIAFSESTLLGMATVRDFDFGFENSPLKPWMTLVYTDKDHRGQGIGSALVTGIENHALNTGINTLYLYTPNEQELYRRLGWIDHETVPNPFSLKGQENATVMKKMLG